MGKKRREHDIHPRDSEESSESEGVCCNRNGKKCTHLKRAIDINRIKALVYRTQWKNACDICFKKQITHDSPMWICLHCGFIGCGRGQESHALDHWKGKNAGHSVVVDTYQWTVWCYTCDSNISSSSTGYKKLDEVTGLLRKWVKSNTIEQNPQLPLCQNEISMSVGKNEKKNMLNDLPKVCGLSNLGNTCFFNAVLQCLAQTPYLVKVLDDLQVPGQKFVLPGGKLKGADNVEIDLLPIEGELDNIGNFTPVLRKTLSEMQNYDGSVYKPSELFSALRKKITQCTDGGQHDAHELLRHLLELVRSEDVKRYQVIVLKEVGLNQKTKPQGVPDYLKSVVKFYGNQLNAKYLGPESVFRGELVSTLECSECHHTSVRNEPFLDLSLPVLVEKSLPPGLKRKNNSFDSSMDSMGSVCNSASKSETKGTPRDASKRRLMAKTKNRQFVGHVNNNASNANRISEEKKGTAAESEESDADIEDNIENEEASIVETNESEYSSEKASAVTSTGALGGYWSAERNSSSADLNVSPVDNDSSSYKFEFVNEISNENNSNLNGSHSSTDNRVKDLTENMKNGSIGLSLMSTSLVVHSDFTSPEGPTISPLSSPVTSKDSPTSTISSAVDGDEIEKVDKLVLRLENNTEKQDASDKEDSNKKASADTIEDTSIEEKVEKIEKLENLEKENHTTKKLTNGVSDVTSNITKLKLVTPSGSPTRYPTKEGECSIQLCLNQFTQLELMSGSNKVGCTNCTEREHKGKTEGVKMVCTDSTKQYLISQVPAVLILHLKRFQVQKFHFRKVGKHVSFPMLLDLAPVCKEYNKRKIYALYGVVEHSGNMYGGHYIAYVKSRKPLKPDDPRWAFLPNNDNSENVKPSNESNSESFEEETSSAEVPQVEAPPGRWYYVSDSRVHEVDERTVLGSEAYLLFYERIL